MRSPLEPFLKQVANPQSHVGGGSVTALTAAIAAALVVKVVPRHRVVPKLERIRQQLLQIVAEDAKVFGGVIRAFHRHDRRGVRRGLQQATALQHQVFHDAHEIIRLCASVRASLAPAMRSDLVCARACAVAAGQGARALIRANLAWLRRQ